MCRGSRVLLCGADGWTDVTKITGTFRNSANASLSRWIMKFSYTTSPVFDDSSRDMPLYVLKKKPARPSGPLLPVYQTTPWNTKEIPNLQNNFPEDLRALTLAFKRDLGCVVVAYDAVAWRVVTEAKGEHKLYYYLRLSSLSLIYSPHSAESFLSS